MEQPPDVAILLVEDEPDDARYVERLLIEHTHDSSKAAGHVSIDTIRHVDRLADARSVVDEVDVVLLDLMLPDSAGMETVERMTEMAPSVPIIVLTSETAVETGVTAIRHGAQDYLVKGSITAELLVRSIRYSIERAATIAELEDRNHRLKLLHRIVSAEINTDVSMIVGRGDQLREAVDGGNRETLEDLISDAQHALDLTKTASDLATALSSDVPVETDEIDLCDILEREINRLDETTDIGLTVTKHLPAEGVPVRAHPLLPSACRELLVNAVTHTDRNSASVEVSLSRDSGRARLEIADDGVGMPATQRDRLTNSENQLTSETAMGTGLYLVTTVLDHVDGDLTVTDNDPRGTVVTVGLELADE